MMARIIKLDLNHKKEAIKMGMKMKVILFGLCLALVLSLGLPSNANAHDIQETMKQVVNETAKELGSLKVVESYGKLPLSFIENTGQVNKEVQYYLKGREGTIYFTKEAIVYDLISTSGNASLSEENNPKDFKRLSFTLKPIGANKEVRLLPKDKLQGKVNYFIGNDPEKWQTDIPIYREIVYKDLYEGIDLKVYGTNNQMEYDFIIYPGADSKAIKVAFEGIDSLSIDKEGNLVIKTPLSELKHLKPLIYQEIDGKRHIIAGSFKVAKNKNSFCFDVKEYNKNYPLIIDPVTLSYSTYLGGSGCDSGEGIAVDSSQNVYVTGMTGSSDFPTKNAYQETNKGGIRGDNVFVTKLDSTGSLSYSTFLGGSGCNSGEGIAVDSSQKAYITGTTDSSDFPTKNAYQETFGGGSHDAFVTKLDSSGNSIIYSTFLGGSGRDTGKGIAVDSSQKAYITGMTISSDFPTKNAYQETIGGEPDAFVTVLYPGPGPTDSLLYYSTYLGGDKGDWGVDIAIDQWGCAYVTGLTRSPDFPTTSDAYQRTYTGSDFPENNGDAFVTKLYTSHSWPLAYSTFLGGSGVEKGNGIAVDFYCQQDTDRTYGTAYVTGYTRSSDFPTKNAYQETIGGEPDAFVTKLDLYDSSLSYSTFLGGSGYAMGNCIAVDSSQNVYVTGRTVSLDFPTKNAYQETFGGGPHDAFVTKLDSSGNSLIYSTYLGGGGSDVGNGIAVDSSGNAYITGDTSSSFDFPTKNAYQETCGVYYDAFVTKLVEETHTAPVTEDFDDGEAQNWIDDGSGCWSVADGTYVMTGNKGEANRYSHYNQEFCDVSYQADVRKIAGDSSETVYEYGMYIRSDGTQTNYYEFTIVVDGLYQIGKSIDGEFTKLVELTRSDAIKKGYNEWNTLKVVAQGSTLQFYANGVLLTTVEDPSLSCGKVGLFAMDSADSDNPDTVQFDNVLIVTTAESIPTLPDKKPIYVDDDFTDDPPNHKWDTIQEGITDANDGDTVLVFTGTYNENVVLNKSLTLVCEGLPTIDASGTGNAITITADNCIVKGFTCVNAYSSRYAGIRVESNNNVIEDNTCKNNDIGIVLVTASENIIAHNTATNNDKTGIYLQDSNNNRIADNTASNNDLNGISLDTSNNNEIRDNNANYNHYQGIRLRTSNENIIANNAAKNNDEYGIALWTSDANIVANNMAKNNEEIGILLSASQNNKITDNDASNTVKYDGISLLDSSNNNEIANNTANSNNFNGIRLYSRSNNNILTNNIANSNREAGILCWTSSGNILTYNDLNSNKYGFWLYNYSSDNILANNTATSNSYGIYVALSSNNNIYLNNFVDNTANAYSYNSNNIWRSASKLTHTYNSKSYWHYLGNYWSDYSGSDTDGDGIGDYSYSLDGDEDEHPLMKPWENYFAP